jgi:hypothetical protein
MYGKNKPGIWNDWCCTLEDYKKLNKLDNSGRCFCADEWEKHEAEAFVASDTASTVGDYGIWALAAVGFGATLCAAAKSVAVFSRSKNYELQGLV